MSGTGNTYSVARWMEEIAGRYNVKTRIVTIEDADFDNDFDQSPHLLVGLLCPTHGFMPPWSMIKFLFRIPRRPGVPVMCAATRGAFRIGPLHIPGASGFATFLAAIIMFFKGYHVKAVFSLDMPLNFISFHWGLHPNNVEQLSNKCRSKLELLIPHILSGRIILFTRNNLWEILWCILIFWLLPVFPIIYLIIARMFMAKLMFSNNSCVGCGMCARYCPNNAILMKNVGSGKRPFWTYHCENCLRCMGYCRKKAVEAGHSWAVLLYFISSIPAIAFALAWLHDTFQFVPIITDYWTIQLLSMIYFLPALFFSYWLFWHLIRIPFVNTLFTFTTLTHYYRRYHHPDAGLRHMAPIRRVGKGEEKQTG